MPCADKESGRYTVFLEYRGYNICIVTKPVIKGEQYRRTSQTAMGFRTIFC